VVKWLKSLFKKRNYQARYYVSYLFGGGNATGFASCDFNINRSINDKEALDKVIELIKKENNFENVVIINAIRLK
jgi:hypothetical protein